ncbi:MAG TPA: hypothetical protein VEZ42_15605 [Pseudonocardia sp.]|nr:hypothetical protein [Pseudonocardia sp.]
MSLLAVAAVLALVVAGLLLLYTVVDRSSRAEAWRRIAEERRWNVEHGIGVRAGR